MAVATKKPNTQKPTTKAADDFVSGGLSRSDDSQPQHAMVRFPKGQAHLFGSIKDLVAARKQDYPKFSQNDWFLEAIAEKIEREQSGG